MERAAQETPFDSDFWKDMRFIALFFVLGTVAVCALLALQGCTDTRYKRVVAVNEPGTEFVSPGRWPWEKRRWYLVVDREVVGPVPEGMEPTDLERTE